MGESEHPGRSSAMAARAMARRSGTEQGGDERMAALDSSNFIASHRAAAAVNGWVSATRSSPGLEPPGRSEKGSTPGLLRANQLVPISAGALPVLPPDELETRPATSSPMHARLHRPGLLDARPRIQRIFSEGEAPLQVSTLGTRLRRISGATRLAPVGGATMPTPPSLLDDDMITERLVGAHTRTDIAGWGGHK